VEFIFSPLVVYENKINPPINFMKNQKDMSNIIVFRRKTRKGDDTFYEKRIITPLFESAE
jgi:hypothetical protein